MEKKRKQRDRCLWFFKRSSWQAVRYKMLVHSETLQNFVAMKQHLFYNEKYAYYNSSVCFYVFETRILINIRQVS